MSFCSTLVRSLYLDDKLNKSVPLRRMDSGNGRRGARAGVTTGDSEGKQSRRIRAGLRNGCGGRAWGTACEL
jgi:hypothetical protein